MKDPIFDEGTREHAEARAALDRLGLTGKAALVPLDVWKLALRVDELERRCTTLEQPVRSLGWRILNRLRFI